MATKSPASVLASQLNAARVAANKARAAEEAPIREARRVLVDRLRKASQSVERANQHYFDKLQYRARMWLGKAANLGLWSFELRPLEEACETAAATFKSRRTDLQLFDAAHGITDAKYLPLHQVDKEAVLAQARAEYEASMAKAREWLRREMPNTGDNE